jgi:hypothetical protein
MQGTRARRGRKPLDRKEARDHRTVDEFHKWADGLSKDVRAVLRARRERVRVMGTLKPVLAYKSGWRATGGRGRCAAGTWTTVGQNVFEESRGIVA